MSKEYVNAMGKTYQSLWRNTIRSDACSQQVSSYGDYMSLCEKHDELRKTNMPYKQTIRQYARARAHAKEREEINQKTIKKRTGVLNEYASIHHGLVEQLRHKGFKKAVDITDPDKETKHQLIDHANKLTSRYEAVGNALKSDQIDRKTSIRALKHLHMRLDPRASMSTVTAQSWLIARNKPEGDRRLRLAMQSMARGREFAHKEAVTALGRSSINKE